MSFEHLARRLHEGRPLVLDADTSACFRSRGLELMSPGAIGKLLRESPDDVLNHYRAETSSRVDVLCALTSDTTPRALAEVGMEHRSAMLTGLSVDLAVQAVDETHRPVAVAGALGSDMVSPLDTNRVAEELEEHALRLMAAGCELIVARGLGSHFELGAAVQAAAATGLPVWAIVEVLPTGELVNGDSLVEVVEELRQLGVQAILFEAAGVERAAAALDRAHSEAPLENGCVYGVLVAATEGSVRGFPDEQARVRDWARGAQSLGGRGARIIGGGAGTTEAHTAALAEALGALHPSIPVAG